MKESIIISGFGGQGVLLAGTLLCYAGMKEGKFVTLLPSYGAEIRGGAASCQVVISDMAVGSPVVYNTGILVSLNSSSYKEFSSKVEKGGIIFANSNLCEPGKINGIEILKIPANDIAFECGSGLFANMVMLGGLVSKKRILKLDSLSDSIPEVLTNKKKDSWEGNRRAVEAGFYYLNPKRII